MKPIEKTIIEYLTTKGYAAYAERPPNPPKEYLIIDRINSTMKNRLWTVTVAVQSIAPTLEQTVDLNEEVISDMLDIVEIQRVTACRVDNSYNYTSATDKKYRYQAVFLISYLED